MIKKTITYEDYAGTERTETFWFNLSRPELVEMEASEDGGLVATIQKISDAKDVRSLVKYLSYIITKSYGEMVDDGRRFTKSPELAKAFTETPAYEILYMELASDEKAATEFIEGILPKTMQKDIAKAKENASKVIVGGN